MKKEYNEFLDLLFGKDNAEFPLHFLQLKKMQDEEDQIYNWK